MNWNVDKTFIQNFHVQVEMSGGIKNILPKDIMYWKLLTFSGLKLITLIFKYPKNSFAESQRNLGDRSPWQSFFSSKIVNLCTFWLAGLFYL